MAFPEDPLGVWVDLDLGDGWEDVTSWWESSRLIQLDRGARGEATRVDPSTCSLTLRNTDGRFTWRNPLGPYYGRIGRNTPIRVTAAGPESYYQQPAGENTGHRLRTPSGVHLDITNDLDVRVEVALDAIPARDDDGAAQVQEIAGRYNTTGTGNRSWRVLVLASGIVELTWSTTGSDFTSIQSTERLPAVAGQRFALRVTLDVDNGAGGHTATFYTADTISGSWTQLGDAVTESGATTIAAPGDASLEIGDINTLVFWAGAGRYYAVELRDGIDGAVLANTPLASQEPGTTAFTDDYGNAWNITGDGEITDRNARFVGEVSAWPTMWGPSGQDAEAAIQASGILRRLSQGAAPLDSTLRRRIPSGNPVAYWPMEEGADASQAYSPVEGVQPMTVSGLDFANDDTLPGSSALPTVSSSGGSISASVPGATEGGWHVEMVYNLDTLPATEQTMLRVNLAGASGGAAYALVRVSTAGIRSSVYDSEGSLIVSGIYSDADALADFTGVWNRLQTFSATSGSSTYVAVAWVDIATGGWWYARTVYTGTPGRVTSVTASWGADFEGMAVGHLGVFDTGGTYDSGTGLATSNVAIYDDADDGFTGETAGGRIVRLCAEEGVPVTVAGYSADTTVMGPQRPGRLLDLLAECADADGGMLAEDPERLGLIYRTRTTVYNQDPALTLHYGQDREVQPPLTPIDDDLRTRNDVTISRPGGSSARAVLETGPLSVQPPPAGVGRYDESLTINLATDDQLPDAAAWRMHLGTVDEARYPAVNLDLARAPHLIPDILDLTLRDRLTITDTPVQWAPGPITQLVQGWTETLGVREWRMRLACAPASPWTVAVVGDDELGRVDTAGSELGGPVTAAATEMRVRTTVGQPWTTDPSDYPIDLRVGGEVVTATACAAGEATPMPAAGDAALTSSASTDHIAPSVDAPGTADLLVCAWLPWDTTTSYTLPGSMTLGAETTGTWSTCADATEQLAAAGATGTRTATQPTADGWAAISVVATGAPVVEAHLSGVSAVAADVTLTTDATTEAGWWLLCLVAWDNNDVGETGSPGADWVLLGTSGLTDTDAPYVAAWAKRAAGGAEAVTVPAGPADDNHARVYVISGATDLTAQAMTVVRSVNGIAKAHSSGADVRLATPPIISH